MKSVSTSEAREHFSDIVNLVAFGKERQILHRRGKELVAIIPIEELYWLEALENNADLLEAKAEFKKLKPETARPWTSIKKELGL
jgi:prevent-host-death family protein